MDNKNSSSSLILLGILILGIFTYISAINILPNNSSNSFFSKDNGEMNTVITNLSLENDKLIITTNNNEATICVKQTKSEPSNNSLCWKNTVNNQITIRVFVGKTYYIWVKDNENKISNYIQYNTNTKNIVE